MGIRIHKAIGYGIPINKETKDLFNYDEDKQLIYHNNHNKFDFCKFAKERMALEEEHSLPWIDFFFLNSTLEKDKDGPKFLSDIIVETGYSDGNKKGLLFIPPDYYQKWFRFSDDIDYYFEKGLMQKDIFESLEMGFFPWPRYENLTITNDQGKLFGDYDISHAFGEIGIIKHLAEGKTKKEKDKNAKLEIADRISKGEFRNFIPLHLVELIKLTNIFKNHDDIYRLEPTIARWWD
jgi:hypothetical protein